MSDTTFIPSATAISVHRISDALCHITPGGGRRNPADPSAYADLQYSDVLDYAAASQATVEDWNREAEGIAASAFWRVAEDQEPVVIYETTHRRLLLRAGDYLDDPGAGWVEITTQTPCLCGVHDTDIVARCRYEIGADGFVGVSELEINDAFVLAKPARLDEWARLDNLVFGRAAGRFIAQRPVTWSPAEAQFLARAGAPGWTWHPEDGVYTPPSYAGGAVFAAP